MAPVMAKLAQAQRLRQRFANTHSRHSGGDVILLTHWRMRCCVGAGPNVAQCAAPVAIFAYQSVARIQPPTRGHDQVALSKVASVTRQVAALDVAGDLAVEE
jgi:hypothetical protein